MRVELVHKVKVGWNMIAVWAGSWQGLRIGWGVWGCSGEEKNEGIDEDWGICGRYTIPASSSPWSTSSGTSTSLNKVYYANNATNGAYYTWCAATAELGRDCIESLQPNSLSDYSICPKGWRLPADREYEDLLNAASISSDSDGSLKLRGSPYDFQYAGMVNNNDTLSGAGQSGYYWSSVKNGNTAFALYLSDSNVSGRSYPSRHYGVSVRCVAQ